MDIDILPDFQQWDFPRKTDLNLPCDAQFPQWRLGSKTTVTLATGETYRANYYTCSSTIDYAGYDTLIIPRGVILYHGSGALANALATFPVGVEFYKTDGIAPIAIPDPSTALEFLAASPQDLDTIEYYISKRGVIPYRDNQGNIVGRQIVIPPAWYSDPNVAMIYNQRRSEVGGYLYPSCKPKGCVFAYEVINDIYLLRLDSEYNVAKLLSLPNEDVMQQQLKDMLGLQEAIIEPDPTTLSQTFKTPGRFARTGIARRSGRDVDLPFTNWLCTHMGGAFHGYAADAIKGFQLMRGGEVKYTHVHKFVDDLTAAVQTGYEFHPEIALCNPFNHLSRQYSNTIDWQHEDLSLATPLVKVYIDQLKLYETINNSFHSGNLYEHSIWTLLHAEKWVDTFFPNRSDNTKKRALFLAFIHDVGKMAPGTTRVINGSVRPEIVYNAARMKYLYYDVRDHPAIGAAYWDRNGLPVMDTSNPQTQVSTLDLQLMATEMGINITGWVRMMKSVIANHRKFGDMIMRPVNTKEITRGTSAYDTALSRYISEVVGYVTKSLTAEQKRDVILTVLLVSVADIMATQPPGLTEKRAEKEILFEDLNIKSRFWPYISNVSKRYSGTVIRLQEPQGDLPTAIQVIEDIMKLL